MSELLREASSGNGSSLPPLSAGTLLREARRAQNLNIAVLAAAMKVTPQKLEALETDRYDELPDANFARALAQALCRHLKIDPGPVLARLPRRDDERLDRLGGGLNAPFRESSGHVDLDAGHALGRPIVWVPLLLVIGTLAVLFVPFDFSFDRSRLAGADRVSETVNVTSALEGAPPSAGPGVFGTGVSEPALHTTPAVPPVVAPAPPPESSVQPLADGADVRASETSGAAMGAAVDAAAGLVVISSTRASWVRVIDAQGRTLLSRELGAGEVVNLDGTLPMALTVGNVSATTVRVRGELVDFGPTARRDNVARLQLQ